MLLSVLELLGLALLCSADPTATSGSSTAAGAALSTGSVLGSSTISGTISGSTSSTVTIASSSAAQTYSVLVGEDGFKYTPSQVTGVNAGDVIEFRFFPQNHSVARAAFAQDGNDVACIPYEDTGFGRVGFWSGFQPVDVVLSDPPIFNLLINDTEPVFFYCSAPGACQQGMIGVINPNSTFTYASQLKYSLNATEEFSPLQYFPKEVAPTTKTTTCTSTSTANCSPATSSSKKFPVGAIVGVVIGGVALLALAAALLYLCGRQKSLKQLLRNTSVNANHDSYTPAPTGTIEAKYPNMSKSPDLSIAASGGRFSPNQMHPGLPSPGYDESYRTGSPAIDQSGTIQTGIVSPQSSPGFPSPAYNYEHAHEMTGMHEMGPQGGQGGQMGLRSQYQPQPQSPPHYPSPQPSPPHQPYPSPPLHPQQQYFPVPPPPPPREQQIHELAAPSRNTSLHVGAPTPQDPLDNRPFSFTASESGYVVNVGNGGHGGVGREGDEEKGPITP